MEKFKVNATFKNGKVITYAYKGTIKGENALQRATRHMHQHPQIVSYTIESI